MAFGMRVVVAASRELLAAAVHDDEHSISVTYPSVQPLLFVILMCQL